MARQLPHSRQAANSTPMVPSGCREYTWAAQQAISSSSVPVALAMSWFTSMCDSASSVTYRLRARRSVTLSGPLRQVYDAVDPEEWEGLATCRRATVGLTSRRASDCSRAGTCGRRLPTIERGL
jgi:hypothetical protein